MEENNNQNAIIESDEKSYLQDSNSDDLSNQTKRKKIINKNILILIPVIVIVVLLIAFFPTETRKTVKEYKSQIETTLDAIQNSNKINYTLYNNSIQLYNGYEGLDEEIREKINKDEDVYTIVALSFDKYIESLSSEYSKDNYNSVNELANKYKSFPDNIKNKIKSKDKLDKTIIEYTKFFYDDIVDEICSMKNDSLDKMKELYDKYKDSLTTDQKKECAENYWKWSAYNNASNYLRNIMKHPDSFYVTKGTVDGVSDMPEGNYLTIVRITYNATNSFGAYLQKTGTVYVTYDATEYDMHISNVSCITF